MDTDTKVGFKLVILFLVVGIMVLLIKLSLSAEEKKSAEDNSSKSKYQSARTAFDVSDYNQAKADISFILGSAPKDDVYLDSALSLQAIIDRLVFTRDSIAQAEEKERLAEQKKIHAAALKNMRKKTDEFEGITWYRDQSSPYYTDVNGFYCYFAVKDGVAQNLRLRIQYAADDWLFINKYIIKVDGQTYEISENFYGEIQSDNGGGGIWEWLDRSVGNHELQIISAVAFGTSPKMRLEGRQYRKDKSITKQQQLALKNVLAAYEALGGKY